MKKIILSLLFLTLASAGFAVAQNSAATDVDRGYLLGAGDVVTGKVLGESDFDFTATVDQDGKIEVPFFDQPIMAQCRTERELRAEVVKLLSKYLRNPQISVRVTERNSRPPAVVSGEVRNPQQVVLNRQARLLELITFAGGPIEGDASGTVRVFRTRPPLCEENDPQVAWTQTDDAFDVPSRSFSLSSIKEGADESNPVIYPGDLIVVEKASPIYITGEIVAPQGVHLPEDGLSLTQAIAMVGGVRREAKTKDIKIYRLKPNSKDREIISANYDSIRKGEQSDVLLSPYDIIEVDKAKKSLKETLLEVVAGVGRTAAGSFGGTLPTRILY